jgi:tetratricopeptide (TPR) repeat protein
VDLIGRTLNTLGALAAEFGRLDDAERLWQGALAAHRRRMAANPRTGPVEAGAILHNLAAVALEAGRYESAIAWADEALAVVGQVLAAIEDGEGVEDRLDRGHRGIRRPRGRRLRRCRRHAGLRAAAPTAAAATMAGRSRRRRGHRFGHASTRVPRAWADRWPAYG